MQESIDIFDGCDKGTFYCAVVDWMIKQLGYALPSMGFPVYWLDPGKTVVDGLREMNLEMHALSMADSACARGGHKVHVYVDHDNVLDKQLWDDVLLQPVELPRVISPCKKDIESEDIPASKLMPTFSEQMFNMMSGGYQDLCNNNRSIPARRNLSANFVKE